MRFSGVSAISANSAGNRSHAASRPSARRRTKGGSPADSATVHRISSARRTPRSQRDALRSALLIDRMDGITLGSMPRSRANVTAQQGHGFARTSRTRTPSSSTVQLKVSCSRGSPSGMRDDLKDGLFNHPHRFASDRHRHASRRPRLQAAPGSRRSACRTPRPNACPY